jgi:hypothetical protein
MPIPTGPKNPIDANDSALQFRCPKSTLQYKNRRPKAPLNQLSCAAVLTKSECTKTVAELVSNQAKENRKTRQTGIDRTIW